LRLADAVAIGKNNLPLTAMGLALGGNARAGMEDTLFLRKGELTQGNRPLVGARSSWPRRWTCPSRPWTRPSSCSAFRSRGSGASQALEQCMDVPDRRGACPASSPCCADPGAGCIRLDPGMPERHRPARDRVGCEVDLLLGRQGRGGREQLLARLVDL
jgi:hypothetical protein